MRSNKSAGSVVKVVEHVIRQLIEPELMRDTDGLFVRRFDAEMVERNSQRPQARRRKFTQKHGILAKNARVYPLVEIHPPLHRERACYHA